MKLGHRGNFVRDTNPSPMPKGFEDVSPKAFIELKVNGIPVTYHDGYYYRQDANHQSAHGESWASRMNKGK